MFNFNTTDTWQIAFSHGHSAMELLKHARDIEQEFVENNTQIDNAEHGKSDYLKFLGIKESLTNQMFKLGGASIILYQGMMEALINNALESEAALSSEQGGSFRNKWINSLYSLGQPDSNFLNYFTSIYKKYRNPLVHPSNITSNTFDDMETKILAAGYQEGWEAFRLLYLGLGHPHDPDSWRVMCEAHNVPEFA